MDNPTKSNTIPQLNTKQQKAIDLLLKGKTDAEVAIAVGVGRDTVNRWRNHNPEFIAVLDEQCNQLDSDPTVRLNRLYFWSLEVIESALIKADVAAAVAVMQALTGEINIQSNSSRKLSVLSQTKRWKRKDIEPDEADELDGSAS
jgi:hypothetical protein